MKKVNDKQESKVDDVDNDVEMKEIRKMYRERKHGNDEKSVQEDPNEELKDKDVIEKSSPLALGISSEIIKNHKIHPTSKRKKKNLRHALLRIMIDTIFLEKKINSLLRKR